MDSLWIVDLFKGNWKKSLEEIHLTVYEECGFEIDLEVINVQEPKQKLSSSAKISLAQYSNLL